MYKEDLALNNQQWLMCHKTQPNQILYIFNMYEEDLALNNLQWLICHKTKLNHVSPPHCEVRPSSKKDILGIFAY